MTDTIKVLYQNNAIAPSSFTNGEYIVKTVSAGVTEVIKSVTLENAQEIPLNILVDDIKVCNAASSTSFEGWEVVAPTKTVKLAVSGAMPLQYPRFATAVSGTSVYSGAFLPVSQNSAPNFTITSTNTSAAALSVSSPTFQCFLLNDYFYGTPATGTWTLYKRSGGVGGTQTSYSMAGINPSTDGVRYIFSINSSTVKTYDNNTQTVGSRTVSGLNAGSTNVSRVHNGYLYVHEEYNSSSVKAFDAVSGTTVMSLGLYASGSVSSYNQSGQSNNNFVVYTATDGFVYLQTYGQLSKFDSCAGWYAWSGSVLMRVGLAPAAGSLEYVAASSSGWGQNVTRVSTDAVVTKNYIFQNSTNQYTYYWPTKTTTPPNNILITISGRGVNNGSYPSAWNIPTDEYFISTADNLKLKISGVEIS